MYKSEVIANLGKLLRRIRFVLVSLQNLDAARKPVRTASSCRSDGSVTEITIAQIGQMKRLRIAVS